MLKLPVRTWIRNTAAARSGQRGSVRQQAEESACGRQAAYERVSAVLASTVRAPRAVEGINSVLRMQQGRHRCLTQGLLGLKRPDWDCHKLTTGKRRHQCPYEILGASLPSIDFWTLLQPPPEPTERVSR